MSICNALNQTVEMLIVAACVELQDRIILGLTRPWAFDNKSVDMIDLTDRIICECGYGPEDWAIPVDQQHWD